MQSERDSAAAAPPSSSVGADSAPAPAGNKAEAERLLGVAEKLLENRDLSGCRDFAVLAQETEPLLDRSDQILAVVDVLLTAAKSINNRYDWYAILQIDRRTDDADLIKKQYRRLALLLHPDKNKFPFADAAFKLVADAWAVLSDPAKKSLHDKEFTVFSKVDLVSPKNERTWQRQQQVPPPSSSTPAVAEQQEKFPIRRNGSGRKGKAIRKEEPAVEVKDGGEQQARLSSFWTACPYCYVLYEYPRVYEGCCLRCHNCRRAFHGALIPSLPPLVPGKEAYYCCWGVFPLGFQCSASRDKETGEGFPNWMPQTFPNSQHGGNGAARR